MLVPRVASAIPMLYSEAVQIYHAGPLEYEDMLASTWPNADQRSTCWRAIGSSDQPECHGQRKGDFRDLETLPCSWGGPSHRVSGSKHVDTQCACTRTRYRGYHRGHDLPERAWHYLLGSHVEMLSQVHHERADQPTSWLSFSAVPTDTSCCDWKKTASRRQLAWLGRGANDSVPSWPSLTVCWWRRPRVFSPSLVHKYGLALLSGPEGLLDCVQSILAQRCRQLWRTSNRQAMVLALAPQTARIACPALRIFRCPRTLRRSQCIVVFSNPPALAGGSQSSLLHVLNFHLSGSETRWRVFHEIN